MKSLQTIPLLVLMSLVIVSCVSSRYDDEFYMSSNCDLSQGGSGLYKPGNMHRAMVAAHKLRTGCFIENATTINEAVNSAMARCMREGASKCLLWARDGVKEPWVTATETRKAGYRSEKNSSSRNGANAPNFLSILNKSLGAYNSAVQGARSPSSSYSSDKNTAQNTVSQRPSVSLCDVQNYKYSQYKLCQRNGGTWRNLKNNAFSCTITDLNTGSYGISGAGLISSGCYQAWIK